MHYFIMKIPNKQELQRVPFNHASELYESLKKCTAKPYSFSVIDAFLASDNHLCSRWNLI